MLLVQNTPDKLPFISLQQTTGLDKDVIYVRRGTKCEKATADEIDKIIKQKLQCIFKESSNLSLDEHLIQLRKLYDELPQKIKVLVKKGEPSLTRQVVDGLFSLFSGSWGLNDEYEERDNPNYPEESYEAFILRMIDRKKLKIEKVLDLK